MWLFFLKNKEWLEIYVSGVLITWETKALNNNVMGKTQRDIIMQNVKVSLLSIVIEMINIGIAMMKETNDSAKEFMRGISVYDKYSSAKR